MADAPKRIWARFPEFLPIDTARSHIHEGTQYIRADIAASQIAEKEAEIERLKFNSDELRKSADRQNQRYCQIIADVNEQARLNDMGAERELALRAERDRLAADNARLRVALDRVRRTLVYPVSTAISARGWSPHNIDDDRMTFMIEEIDAALAKEGQNNG